MKKKIMAMVFAAMMMVGGISARSSSYSCRHAEIYCKTPGTNATQTQEVLVTNTVLICGETEDEKTRMLTDWHDLICGKGNHTR